MFAPGAVPQPLVQVRLLIPQPFGSTKPSCSPVRLAPKVEFASTVSVCTPCHPGSVACTALNASTLPAPTVLSGAGPSGKVLPTRRFLIVVRAASAVAVEVLRFSRHGALWRTSAAIPPTCGAAADVPKKGAGNDPAPLIDTPSMAARSGFNRPSSVGPRLLKNSGVLFEVSRHDSSGAPENAPAAEADAEQIAPTAMTLTGDPPASPCAEMLRVAVL